MAVINKYESHTIDPNILSIHNVDQAGDVVSAETWVALWDLVWNLLAKYNEHFIDTYNTLKEINAELSDCTKRVEFLEGQYQGLVDRMGNLETSWSALQEAYNKVAGCYDEIKQIQNTLESGFVHYGEKPPASAFIKLWVMPTQGVPSLITSWGENDILATNYNYASAKLIRDTFNSIQNQVDILNAGGLNLKDSFIRDQISLHTATYISQWLDEHPEATTTVLDNSLEETKFTENLRYKTINGYITPEMYRHLVKPVIINSFATTEDGEHVPESERVLEDWSDAIQKAVDDAAYTQKTLLLTQLYYIDKPIEITQTVHIVGAGTTNPRGDDTIIHTHLDGVRRKKYPQACGFKHRSAALRLKPKYTGSAAAPVEIAGAGVGITIDNVYFTQSYKETDPTDGGYRIIGTLLQELIESGGANAIEVYPAGQGNFSRLSITNCDFCHTAGYALKFMPVPEGKKSYYQMLEFKNISCWNGCGGIICAKTEDVDTQANPQDGVFITCATFDNINLDNGAYISPFTQSFIDLSGVREYTLTNVVLEGSTTGNIHLNTPLIRVSNSRWQTINGIHVEFGAGLTFDYALEIAQSRYVSEGAKNSSLFLYNVPSSILLSANHVELHLYGIFSASKKVDEPSFTITGTGSSIIVDTMMVVRPSYNLFNHEVLGKIKYNNFSTINDSGKLPVSFRTPTTLFEWDARKGPLATYDEALDKYTYLKNDYFTLVHPVKKAIDGLKSGLVYDENIGTVYRVYPKEGYTGSFHLAINPISGSPDNAQKRFLLGKRLTLSITYRANTNGVDTNIMASSMLSGANEYANINNCIADSLAIGVTSVVVNETNNGFTIGNIGNTDGNQYFDIVGFKICIGDEVEGMAPVFENLID